MAPITPIVQLTLVKKPDEGIKAVSCQAHPEMVDPPKTDATPVPGMDPNDAALIVEGKDILEKVNINISKEDKPFKGLSDEDKRMLLAYVILKRENQVIGKGDHLNFEAAVKTLDPETFDDSDTLDARLVKQLNKLKGVVQSTLVHDDKKGVIVKKES
jgi:hypothetical protein